MGFKRATTFSEPSRNNERKEVPRSTTNNSGGVRDNPSTSSKRVTRVISNPNIRRVNTEQKTSHIQGTNTNVYLNNTPETKAKFKRLEPYRRVMLRIINDIEDVYELDSDVITGAPDRLRDAPIQKLSQRLIERIKFTTAGKKREKNKKASAKVASLLYIGYSMQFNGVVRLDFNDLAGQSDIRRYLIRYANVKGAKDSSKTDLNAILFLLDSFEKTRLIGIYEDVAYRLLRLFYILVLYDNLIDASVVASLILQQINKREG